MKKESRKIFSIILIIAVLIILLISSFLSGYIQNHLEKKVNDDKNINRSGELNSISPNIADTNYLLRLYNPKTGAYFWTISNSEASSFVNSYGYQNQGAAAYLYSTQQSGTVPLLRLYNPKTGAYFWTISNSEASSFVNSYGYQNQGAAAYLYSTQQSGTVPLLRLYNPKTGAYFWTISNSEASSFVNSYGYQNQGAAAYLYSTQQSGTDENTSKLIGKYLVFSYSSRTIDSFRGIKENLYLGYFNFINRTDVVMTYFYYDPDKSYFYQTNHINNNMNAPYKKSCTPFNFSIAPYDSFYQDTVNTGKWIFDGSNLQITFGGNITQNWSVNQTDNTFFKLKNITSKLDGPSRVTYSNLFGFGYLATNITNDQKYNKTNFYSSYNGEYYENNNFSKMGNWRYQNLQWNIYLYNSQKDPNLYSFDYDCADGTHMWCQSSFLLNYAPYSKNLIYIGGGHDFNLDGCMNDYGHAYTLFGIKDDKGKISKIVFIEYSHQVGMYPIIGVGRYYAY